MNRVRNKIMLSYMAGLFDGEGCVSLAKHDSGQYYNLACYIVMTNECIPQLFQFHFGGKVYKRASKNHPLAKQIVWRWAISSQQAYRFLKTIYPFMIVKKPQAEVAFRFTEEHIYQTGSKKLTTEQVVLKEADAILMSKLNKGRSTTKEEWRNGKTR